MPGGFIESLDTNGHFQLIAFQTSLEYLSSRPEEHEAGNMVVMPVVVSLGGSWTGYDTMLGSILINNYLEHRIFVSNIGGRGLLQDVLQRHHQVGKAIQRSHPEKPSGLEHVQDSQICAPHDVSICNSQCGFPHLDFRCPLVPFIPRLR